MNKDKSNKNMESTMESFPIRKKIQHFWHYYHTITIVIIICILLIISFIKTISINKANYDAYCLILNDVNNTKLAEKIKEEFPVYMRNSKALISVDYAYPFNYLEEFGISWPDESAIVKIMSLDENKADIAVSDYSTMLWAVHERYIYPLNEILPSDLMEKLKPYYEYARFKGTESDDGIIYGLNISDTKLFQGYSNKYENAVIFVPNLTVNANRKKQQDMSVKLIKYFFEIE